MKVVSFQNYDYKAVKGEVNTKPSLTVPEMTMSLSTILERFTRGGSVATLTPIYHGDVNVPEYEKMDAIEKLEARQELVAAISRARSRAAAAEKKKKEVVSPVQDEAPNPKD